MGASFRADMTAFREEVSQRFERADTPVRTLRREMSEQFASVNGDIANLKEDVSGLKEDVTGMNDKLDTLIAEIRSNRN